MSKRYRWFILAAPMIVVVARNRAIDRLRAAACSMRARSAEEVPGIAERIDALFRNTTAPTKTESEKAFLLGFLSMMGNVQFLITSISSVVIFTIVLVAANTMAMSIRERVREIGILKALGFRKSQILSLLLGESVFLALSGALLGSLTAKILFSRVRLSEVTGGFLQHLNVTPGTLGLSVAIGVFVLAFLTFFGVPFVSTTVHQGAL